MWPISPLKAIARICWTLFALLVPAQAQRPLSEPVSLWGSLVSGPHQVGFHSTFEIDHGRRDRPWSMDRERCITEANELLRRSPNMPPRAGACGNSADGKEQAGLAGFRPLLLAIWYPASGPSSPRMRLRDYTDLPLTPELSPFATRLKTFSEVTAKESVLGKKATSISKAEQFAFDELFQMPTQAFRDAPAAPGRFPLVIYHPGAAGSFDENVILFEFLASHGYVVISSAYQTNTVHVSNDVDLVPRSIRDMQFLMQAASKLPYVNATKSAGVGHSAGAHTLMQWIGEIDCPLAAMVSLDTTLEYTPRNFAGHKELRQTLEKMEKPTIPIMLFASAERRPNFTTFDGFLQRAPRYEAAVSHLRHTEYISQGAMRAALPSNDDAGRNSSPSSMRDSYDQVCLTIRRFLDLVLKSDDYAQDVLRPSSALAVPPSSMTVRYKAPR